MRFCGFAVAALSLGFFFFFPCFCDLTLLVSVRLSVYVISQHKLLRSGRRTVCLLNTLTASGLTFSSPYLYTVYTCTNSSCADKIMWDCLYDTFFPDDALTTGAGLILGNLEYPLLGSFPALKATRFHFPLILYCGGEDSLLRKEKSEMTGEIVHHPCATSPSCDKQRHAA